AVLCVVLAFVFRPWSRERSNVPALQFWLGVFLEATAAQLIPLPTPLLDAVSLSARAALSQLVLVMPDRPSISIDEPATRLTLAVNVGLAIVFLSALRIFETGGVRVFARGLAMTGLLLS